MRSINRRRRSSTCHLRPYATAGSRWGVEAPSHWQGALPIRGRLRTLEAFRSTANQQLQAGQLVQALDAAAAGLKIDPRDPTLNTVMRTLLREAQEDAARSKQDATDLDAPGVRAEEAFNQGLLRETQAVRPATDGQD